MAATALLHRAVAALVEAACEASQGGEVILFERHDPVHELVAATAFHQFDAQLAAPWSASTVDYRPPLPD